jgi:8-oxo-dGTP pyrophosphatase MutT (NUDIX family)
MVATQPRVKSICVIRRDDSMLVIHAYDTARGQTFYTPLGGGVEFGERGREAIRREFKEEIGADITDVRFVGVLENLFTLEGRPGHEIVLVYEARLTDASLYKKELFEGRDTGGPFKAEWKAISSFNAENAPLYPEGLLDLVGKPPSTGF